MKIYKNFISKKDFLKIKNTMNSDFFPWFFSKGVTIPEDGLSMFCHTFYTDSQINSTYYSILEPILKKINPYCLIRIKANLYARTDEIIVHKKHIDAISENAKIKTAVFYLNTNNGYTYFENNEKVLSTENTFVEFDSHIMHGGTTCTDQLKRMMINFNYIPKNNLEHKYY